MMAMNPGRWLMVTGELVVDPVAGITVDGRPFGELLRGAFAEGPEMEDDTLPLVAGRLTIEVGRA